MGRDKAMLPFGHEVMLQRVVRLVAKVVSEERIVVVAAMHQALPGLPRDVSVARDSRADNGPLEGFAAGLRALGDKADAVYVSGCDAPLLVPAFVEEMFARLGECDAVVPFDGEHSHSLAAVYRPSVVSQVAKLLANGQFSFRDLLATIRSCRVPVDELRVVDSSLASLKNLNAKNDYLIALKMAGFEN